MDELEKALAEINLKILKYDASKQRPVTTNRGTVPIEKFCKIVLADLSRHATKYPKVWDALHDLGDTEKMLIEHAKALNVFKDAKGKIEIEIPPDMEGLTLNLDLTAKGRDDKFFLTHPDETISEVAGDRFVEIHQIDPMAAVSMARKVIPRYLPREKRGVVEVVDGKKTKTVFNSYIPPKWKRYKKWDALPDKLPPIFEKLVKHLFPLKEEREYFFAWLHSSMFLRAFVFLVLCGPPGVGKNTLKKVLRALHGHANSVDGKKSTLVERFNSQLSEATLAWFDELHYDMDMENLMKELQNDSISIERKGVDATRATRIYSSIVISNNKPRDNYLAFDARKFAPMVLTPKRLEESLTMNEIDVLSRKVEDETSPDFDIAFIAQIAKWVNKHGASKKWPNLEYRGPMFWTLAHTSMSRWQKRAVMLILDPVSAVRSGYDIQKKAFLWSTVQDKAQRKNGDRSLQFPDFTSVRAFFEVFRDGKGQKAFSTEEVGGNNLMGDFWVRPLIKGMEIITEASVSQQRSKASEKEKKETFDL